MTTFGGVEGFAPPPGAAPELQHWFAQLQSLSREIKLNLPFYVVSGVDDTGIDNVTTDIQELLDLARTQGGGTVFIPKGTYSVLNLTVGKFVNIKGNGLGTILKQIANAHDVDDTGTASGGTVNTLDDTSKAWTVNEHQLKTLRITSGVLSGETRVIVSNTATQLEIGMESGVGGDNFASAVVSGMTYEILDFKSIITSYDDASSHWTVSSIQLDGNKANQIAYNPAILVTNDPAVVEGVDSHQIIRDVWIQDPSGWGFIVGGKKVVPFTVGNGPREILFDNVVVHGAGRHSKITWPGGGTDCRYQNCVSASSGLSGFVLNGSGDKYMLCKSFGSGQLQATNNASGFLVTGAGQHAFNIYGQENWEHGVHCVNADRCNIYMNADANQENGLMVFNSHDSIFEVQAESGAGVGLLYVQKQAVGASGFPDDATEECIFTITADSGHTVGIIDSSLQDPSSRNDIRINDPTVEINRLYTGVLWPRRGDGTEVVPPLRIGQNVDISTTTPVWDWTIDFGAAAPTDKAAIVNSYDGTNVHRYFRLSHTDNEVIIGDGTVGEEVYPRLVNVATASLPAAGSAGRLVYNPTSGSLYYDDGSAWADVATGAHTHPASDIVSGTFADARIAQSNVTQHQAALSIAASQITTGTFGAGAYTFPDALTVLNGIAVAGDRVSVVRDAIGTDREAFMWAHDGAPALGNPYYVWKIEADSPPAASLSGYDGTTSHIYQRLMWDVSDPWLEIGDRSTTQNTPKVRMNHKNGPDLTFVRYDTALGDNGVLGQISFRAVDDEAYPGGLGALIVARSNGAWTGSTGVRGSDLEFWLNDGAGATTRYFTLYKDGYAEFLGVMNVAGAVTMQDDLTVSGRAGIGRSASSAYALIMEDDQPTTGFRIDNVTAAGASNGVILDFVLNTDLTLRTFFRVDVTSSTIADATRTSTVDFIGVNSGSFTPFLTAVGTAVTIPGAVTMQGDLTVRPNTIRAGPSASQEIFLYADAAATTLGVDHAVPLRFYIDSAEKARLVPAGHLALGTTDVEPWGSGYKALQISAVGSFASTTTDTVVSRNAYWDGTSWDYQTTDEAQQIAFGNQGQIIFRVAASGTADTAITWTDALTIQNGGGVGIGTGTLGSDKVRIREALAGGIMVVRIWNDDPGATVGTGTRITFPVFNGASGLTIHSHGVSSGSGQVGNYDAEIYTGQAGSHLYLSAGSGNAKHLGILDNGDVAMLTGKKFFLGSAYIDESSTNVIRFTAGGTAMAMGLGGDIRVYLDVVPHVSGRILGDPAVNRWSTVYGVNADFTGTGTFGGAVTMSSTLNVLSGRLNVPASGAVSVSATFDVLGGALRIDPGQRFYLDAGANTYIVQSSADVIDFVAQDRQMLRLDHSVLDSAIVEIGVKSTTVAGPDLRIVEKNGGALHFVRYDTAIGDNAVLAQMNFYGLDDASYPGGLGGLLIVRSNAAWSASTSVMGTDLEWWSNDGTGIAERFTIEKAGQVRMRVSADPSTVANFAHIYAKDVASSAEMFVRDEAGNVTQISPHDPFTGEWIFDSRNERTGRRLRIRMEALLKAVEDHLGTEFIEEFTE